MQCPSSLVPLAVMRFCQPAFACLRTCRRRTENDTSSFDETKRGVGGESREGEKAETLVSKEVMEMMEMMDVLKQKRKMMIDYN